MQVRKRKVMQQPW